jgi:hypothetical protein
MKLTQEQIEWVKREQKYLRGLIESKTVTNFGTYRIREEALFLIVELHNMQLTSEKKEQELRAKIKEEERQALIEKGKENLGINE